MNNALSIVRGDMVRHKVKVTLPGEVEVRSLYLLMILAETNIVEDLQKTFGTQVTHLHLRLAKKIWGDKKRQNTYGVFFSDEVRFNDEVRMVFAFNRLFADFKDGQVVYYDLDELIEKAIDGTSKPQPSTDLTGEPGIGPVPHLPPYHSPFAPFHGRPDIIVRYSIPDPSEEKPE